MSIILGFIILISAVALLHPYTTYPCSLVLIGKFRKCSTELEPEDVADAADAAVRFSILFCCYNEADSLPSKLNNLKAISIKYPACEILAYADGCTDDTVRILKEHSLYVTLIVGQKRKGKSYGMKTLTRKAKGDFFIMTDANVIVSVEGIESALTALENSSVGVVCGRLEYVNSSASITANVGVTYWNWEERLKQLESQTGSTMGADGSLFAIKSDLYREAPVDIIDDFFTSMSAIFQGSLVRTNHEFMAYEKSAETSKDEFQRKIRISNRAYNCHIYMKKSLQQMSLLNKYKYYSHKFIRWHTFTFVLLILICSIVWLGAVLTIMQMAKLLLVWLGLCLVVGLIFRVFAKRLFESLLLVVAVWFGVVLAMLGRKFVTWEIAKSSR